jgi:hypothetical protein
MLREAANDTLADHIRDAAANLKAGIEKLKPLTEQALLANGCRCGTRDFMPPEIHKAAHALSYAVKAVEAKAEPLRTSTPSFECLESALTAISDKCTARGKTAIEPIIDFIDRAIPLHPSTEAMMAAVELEIEAAIGKVQTRTIGRIVQKAINASISAPQAADAKAEPLRDPAGEMVLHPLSDIRDLDDVVRELDIESSHTTPAEAVRELKEEIERLRAAPPTVDRTATDLNKVWQAAEACWASNAPRQAVDILYYEILRLIGHPITGADINDSAAPAVDRAAVIEEVIAERRRQIAKGYDAAHDDAHDDGSIATAAAVYALHPFVWHLVITEGSKRRLLSLADFWPWEWSQFEPADERRNLVRSAAMIIAEIERLDRALADAKGDGK